MGKFCIFLLVMTFAGLASASWYWPFGSETPKEVREAPRISDVMEPVSQQVDKATDLADNGEVNEAVEAYRQVLIALDEIERVHPQWTQGAEFSTIRNKRAYVNARIDSLLLGQVRANAKPVAVCDTTGLEIKLARERWRQHADAARAAVDHHDRELCAREIDAARSCTTNRALQASLYGIEAMMSFVMGDGQETCLALDRMLGSLGGVENLSREDSAALNDGLRDIRNRAVDWCDEAIAYGEGARAASGRFDELRRTNAVATAVQTARNDIARKLRRQQNVLKNYPFEEAIALSNATDVVLGQLNEPVADGVDWAGYDTALAGYRNLVAAFGGVRKRIKSIDARIGAIGRELGPAEPATVTRRQDPEVKPPSPDLRALRDQAVKAMARGDFAAAESAIGKMLAAQPSGAMALNLKAMLEMRQGKLVEAAGTLERAIAANPESYYAYYNKAILILQARPGDKAAARQQYEAGRSHGGPVDARLEGRLK